ncbi:MAG TPA: glucuronate isomerase, partial [Terriglobales bacterium]|nr:glucuronate isomerase [Terriglobales bacterium]
MGTEFIHEDFLLHTKAARRLYHDYAASEPILDYHSHLPAAEIAGNRNFTNLFEIWLEGDHYKWRAMRANGIPERCCTGDAPAYEKYFAWAHTVPFCLRNPLFHWTHLELKRYFGIGELLNESNAKAVWERANAMLQNNDLSAQGILKKFQVKVVCSSDDPIDDLSSHRAINAAQGDFRVYPTFRPDRALATQDPAAFKTYLTQLEAASGKSIVTLANFLDALKQRHDYFHALGGRLSDHGLSYCFASPCTERQASTIFTNVRGGTVPTSEEQEQFASFLMLFFGRLDAEKGWTKQLHVGALRNANTRRTRQLGPNTGFDSIGDWPQAQNLCAYLDLLEQENALPKLVVYNLNPADNYLMAAAVGNFQDGEIAGKIQFGSGWWFLDQKEGIEMQLNALSNTGLLSRFVGMLTDSRSFMSFPRHEYFRRVLCNLLGNEMENGELPNDDRLIGNMVRNICFENA